MTFESYCDWSKAFTAARKHNGDVEEVIALWKAKVPGEWARQAWEDSWGYRKTSKQGAENSGEKLYERCLLDEHGALKKWTLRRNNRSYDLTTGYHNFALANRREGQVIADVLAVLSDGRRTRPILVEVKVTNEGPWHALVECLKQVVLARKAPKPICAHLNKKGIVSPGTGAWGLVIAPKAFWKKGKQELVKCEELLLALKTRTNARIALASLDLDAGRKKETQEIDWVMGNWN